MTSLQRLAACLALAAGTSTLPAQKLTPAQPKGRLSAPSAPASAATAQLPRLVEHDGHYALLVDGAPFLLLGAQIHNSSAWPGMMPRIWPALEAIHINTLEAPVYWESLEPTEGHFDFAQTDLLVNEARAHNVRLVLLWFGTWKNGSGHYIPEWMKRDEARFPHVLGPAGRPFDSLSPHSQPTLDADKRAFAALMRHLKAIDAAQHTVIMVQVENEVGTYGSQRDFSPAADKLFHQDVPAPIRAAMNARREGPWDAVFGDEADEYFHAWSIARYVNEVAAAGKAEYPLPLYVNVALRDPLNPGRQGSWENGAPTDDVLPMWKQAGPSLDLIAPDIYLPAYDRYTKLLDLYSRPDNALLVPETGSGPDFARYCFAVIGHGGIGFSPFGADDPRQPPADVAAAVIRPDSRPDARPDQMAFNYAALGQMDRLIAQLNFEGKVQGSSENPAVHTQRLPFGDWTAVVQYGRPTFGNGGQATGNTPPDGEALIAQTGPGEFIVTAYHARVDFEPKGATPGPPPTGPQRQFLRVEEGSYLNGVWKPLRIWNGDETDYGLNFRYTPQILHISLATY